MNPPGAAPTGSRCLLPDPPDDWADVPPAFLAALHECGRTAAREDTRIALSRARVQGAAGRVVGTDGRAALLWGGCTPPFPTDVLVRAVPVFGTRELAEQDVVRVGRPPMTVGRVTVLIGRVSHTRGDNTC